MREIDPPHESGAGTQFDWDAWRIAKHCNPEMMHLPSPLEIRAECRDIQAHWTPEQEIAARLRVPGSNRMDGDLRWYPPAVGRVA
jgi:hypothetical protein